MIARASALFAPTLRDAPADAESVSHKLLVRGGFIRQVAAGVWSFQPLGWRVHEKVVQIIREERDEPRPGKGLVRLREFIMKDSYSFDRDEAGLDVQFENHRTAYERIFER